MSLAWVLLSMVTCTADLRDLRAEECTLRLNGVCNEPDVCEVGADAADCHTGPYGACHDLLTGIIYVNRCTARGDSLCIPGALPANTSICSRNCTTDEECPRVPGYRVACKEMELFGADLPVRACAISCDAQTQCPNGMACQSNGQCAWTNGASGIIPLGLTESGSEF